MKRLALITLILFAAVFLPSVAKAAEIEEIYDEYYTKVNADSIKDALPQDTADELERLGLGAENFSKAEGFSFKNIFSHIADIIKSGFKRPLISACAVIGILLFSSCMGELSKESKLTSYVVSLSIAAAVLMPVVSVVGACVSAVKAAGVFMLSFIPVYAGVLVAKGRSLTAAGFSTVMLGVSEAVTSICSFVIVPLTGMQLGLSLSGAAVTEINLSSVSRAVTKVSKWVLGLSTTVLLGVLSMQTLISGSADSLSFKTTRFLVGSAVPIVGSAVAEALATVKGCVGLLGSSVAVYGIAAVALLFLPLIVELLIWRVMLMFTSSIAEMLSQIKAAELIKTVDNCISTVLGVLIFIGVLFVISITVVFLA
ncbi:MAG: hypothetical protein IJA41_09075 [Clostridia bacterium]|nr:hypothetical protein [Clostridia bacterium]